MHLLVSRLGLCLVALSCVVNAKRTRTQSLEQSFRQCCKAHGMPAECARAMCSYKKGRLTKETQCDNAEACTAYASEWLHCAMDGNDVTDCVRDRAAELDVFVPPACFGQFLSGTAPSLNNIFENGPTSSMCLQRIYLFDECYKKSIRGWKHQNVCLKPSGGCQSFDHDLSQQGQRWYDFFIKISKAKCDR